MRAGASTVQQTLTPEAASILKHAVTDACRRGHAQATPLHVAATLLGAQGSPLREACLRTHPHPPQLPHCRALELCFNIALERLQAASGPLPGGQPSYSNALVAALKRAQAHQRRGCPEQQQQPLLAVKVELEQLVISILDDPSVSRVMREAGFNSTDVKNHLEETVSLIPPHHHHQSGVATDHSRLSLLDQMSVRLGATPSFLPGSISFPPHHIPPQFGRLPQDGSEMHLHLRPPRAVPSVYTNPRFAHAIVGGTEASQGVSEDTKRVLDVMLRKKRRNPVLCGDSGASVDAVVRDVTQRLDRGDVPEQLQGVKAISLELSPLSLLSATKEELKMKFLKLNASVQELMPRGAIVLIGDLQWLVQLKGSMVRPSSFCPVTQAAHEISELLDRYQGSGRLWLISTATSLTFLGFQKQHAQLEAEWELQPVPITASGLNLSLSSRYKTQEPGAIGVDSSLSLSLRPIPSPSLKLNSFDEGFGDQASGQKLLCCSECRANYEKEAVLLQDEEKHACSGSPPSCSSSVETPSKEGDVRSNSSAHSTLPEWLQKALPTNSKNAREPLEVKEKCISEKLQELRKRWSQNCRSSNHQNVCLNMSAEKLSMSPSRQTFGGALSRYQERSLSLLKDNASRPTSARTTAALFSTATSDGNQHLFGALGPGIPAFLQSGIAEQQRQINTFKERVHDPTCSSPSTIRLPWQVSAPATPNCMEAVSQHQQLHNPGKGTNQVDMEALSRLCKGLAERVGWQKGVISAIANSVMQCRSGLGKRHSGFKGDAWLLFLGHDRAGKKKMAEALAELIFGCEKKPVVVPLRGQLQQQDLTSPSVWGLGPASVPPSRGKMPLDQVAQAVRQNPSSVVLLEDLEHADSVCKSGLLRALSGGRLQDSNGREVSLGNAIVVLTSSLGVTEIDDKNPSVPVTHLEEVTDCNDHSSNYTKCMGEQQQFSCKRKCDWSAQDDSINKKSCLGRALSLDLNMSIEDNAEACHSDVASDMLPFCMNGGEPKRPHEPADKDQVLSMACKHLREFCDLVDAAVVFAPPPV